jgi:hypothetical protein
MSDDPYAPGRGRQPTYAAEPGPPEGSGARSPEVLVRIGVSWAGFRPRRTR